MPINKLRGNPKVEGCSEFQERCEITKLLSELPGDKWDSRDFWDNLGPDGQAAWRQELFQKVVDSEQLRRGLVEACCWWANKDAFAELQPVLKKCIRDANDFNFLDSLVSHPSRTVQLRSRGLLQLISSGSLAPLIANASSPIPEADTPSRTWMGNPKVESFLYRCVRSVEIETATDIKSNFSQD